MFSPNTNRHGRLKFVCTLLATNRKFQRRSLVSFRGIAMTPKDLWSFTCAVQHSIRLIANGGNRNNSGFHKDSLGKEGKDETSFTADKEKFQVRNISFLLQILFLIDTWLHSFFMNKIVVSFTSCVHRIMKFHHFKNFASPLVNELTHLVIIRW